ncbi:hypothetical protein NEOC65_002169 [Neochlamydia sp. AcF65]|nr:hypothetical protein [Neochlamydia sp. AcF65]
MKELIRLLSKSLKNELNFKSFEKEPFVGYVKPGNFLGKSLPLHFALLIIFTL